MSILKFEEKDAKVILQALDLRIQSCQGDSSGIAKTENIIADFTRFAAFEGYNLKEKHKSWVIGCIRTGFIDPNIELMKMSDYDVLISDTPTINKIEELIEIIKIRNRLLSKKEMKDPSIKKYPEFTTRLDRISKFKKIQKILHSNSHNENKMAILLEDGTGIKYRAFDTPIKNFYFERIISGDYTHSMDPKKFVDKYIKSTKTAFNQVIYIVKKYCE